AIVLGAGSGIAALLLLPRLVGAVPLSPFIVTLAMWGMLRGLAKGLGDNQPVYVEGQPDLLELMGSSGSGFGGIAAPAVWITAAAALLAALVLRGTRFGRHVFAIGSSEPTA